MSAETTLKTPKRNGALPGTNHQKPLVLELDRKEKAGFSITGEEIGLLDIVIFDEITKNKTCRQ